jgi:hypothetical protein
VEPYNNRRVLGLALLAFVAASLLQWATLAPKGFLAYASIAVASCTPAIAFYYLIRTRLWRGRPFARLIDCTVPNLNGRWVGFLRSTYSEFGVHHPVAVEILQSLDKTAISYFDENATHQSISANIIVQPSGHCVLHELYLNVPGRVGLMTHHGAMRLNIDSRAHQMWGRYYNDPVERSTYGEIYLVRCSSQRRGKPPDEIEIELSESHFQIT